MSLAHRYARASAACARCSHTIGISSSMQQRDRHRARDRPVAVTEELGPQHFADHQLLGAAEQRRDHELADRGDEHQHRAGDDARHRQRQRDLHERLPRTRAEIRSRFQQRQVQLLQVRVQRQDHERQVRVDDADVDREVGLQHHQRLVDDADPHQEIVDEAVVLEDADPGVHAQQERRPERQDHHHQQDVAPGGVGASDGVGDRIADQQAQERRDRGDLQRVEIRAPVQVVFDQVQEIADVELDLEDPLLRPREQRLIRRQRDLRLREADLQHDHEWDQEEQQQPQIRHGDDGRATGHAPMHESRTRPAIRRQRLEEPQQQLHADTAALKARFLGARAHSISTTGLDAVPVQIHLLIPGDVVGVAMRVRLRHAHHLAGAELHQVHAHVAHVGDLFDDAARDVVRLLRRLDARAGSSRAAPRPTRPRPMQR